MSVFLNFQTPHPYRSRDSRKLRREHEIRIQKLKAIVSKILLTNQLCGFILVEWGVILKILSYRMSAGWCTLVASAGP